MPSYIKQLFELCYFCSVLWPWDWKRSVFIPIPKKGNAKECSNYLRTALISHATKLHSKSFKLGFSSISIENFQMKKLGLEKAEEPEIKLPTFMESWKRQGNSRKTCNSPLLSTQKPLTIWITTNCRKFLKGWKYQTVLPVSWETCMWVKKQ